jgi:hypothetical protein
LQLAKFFKVTVDYLLNNDTTGLQSIQPRKESTNDLMKFLDQSEVLLEGMSKEDKAKIKASLDIIFWDTKQKKQKNRKSIFLLLLEFKNFSVNKNEYKLYAPFIPLCIGI